MSDYNGWLIVDMPIFPGAPAGFEFQHNAIVSVNTNPFTGQQQVYSWGASYKECSVSLQPMTQVQAQPWIVFLEALNGTANVFTFSDTLCALYPNELTTDGTTARYWRMKSSQSKWSIQRGNLYALSFEIREAI